MDCPDPIRVYDTFEARWFDMPCRRRRCGYCGPAHWRPLKLATLHAGLKGDPDKYLVVLLTAPADAGFADAWNEGASVRWNHWITLIRQWHPDVDVQFWRVAELQVRGHVHYHVVIRGLEFLDVVKIRRAALMAGFGLWVGVRRPRSYPQGLRGLGGYLGKYLLKDAGRRLPKRGRMVTMSQGWLMEWENRRQPGGCEPGRFWVRVGRKAPWADLLAELPPARIVRPPNYFGPVLGHRRTVWGVALPLRDHVLFATGSGQKGRADH